MNPEELKNATQALCELGLSYQEALDAMSGVGNDVDSIKRLWRINNKSKLIKLGLTLITFPEPTPISETLGTLVLSLGLLQRKRSQSTLHVDDVYNTFQEALRSLNALYKE